MKDVIAATLSGLCVVHCLATPALIAVGGSGLLISAFDTEWFHYLLLLPISLLLVWSLPGGWCLHQRKAPFILGLSGFLLLLAALLAPHETEAALSVAGGLLLTSAHLYNRKLLHKLQELQHAAN